MDCGLQMKLGSMQKMVTDVAVDRSRGVAVPGEESVITMVANTGDAPVTIPVSIPASSSLRQPGNLQLSKCEHHTPRPRRPRRSFFRRRVESRDAPRRGSSHARGRERRSECHYHYHWGSSALATATR